MMDPGLLHLLKIGLDIASVLLNSLLLAGLRRIKESEVHDVADLGRRREDVVGGWQPLRWLD